MEKKLSKIFTPDSAAHLQYVAAEFNSKAEAISKGSYELFIGCMLEALERDYRQNFYRQFRTEADAMKFLDTSDDLTGLAKQVVEDARKLRTTMLPIDSHSTMFKTSEKLDIVVSHQRLAPRNILAEIDSNLLIEDLGNHANVCFANTFALEPDQLPTLSLDIAKTIHAALNTRFASDQLEFFSYTPGVAAGHYGREIFGQFGLRQNQNGNLMIILRDEFDRVPRSIAELTFQETANKTLTPAQELNRGFREFQLGLSLE